MFQDYIRIWPVYLCSASSRAEHVELSIKEGAEIYFIFSLLVLSLISCCFKETSRFQAL